MLDLTEADRRPLGELVARWVSRHPRARVRDQPSVRVLEVEVLRAGRPGLLDVLADVEGALAHAVLGLRRPGEELHALGAREEAVLGTLEDADGPGVVTDALHDAVLAPLVLAAVTGGEPPAPGAAPLREDEHATVLGFASGCTLTVFPWLGAGPHPGVEMLVALDERGFNHLATPLVLWRRGGRDLGLVQELLVGSADGWAVALTSLRDLYGSGGRPEDAGGDFAGEARALGVMTARMHVGLEQAFGRRTADPGAWVDSLALGAPARAGRAPEVPAPVVAAVSALRGAPDGAVLRTHGDFHLGRTARTDQGWVVADCAPGGRPGEEGEPELRPPLADVADLLWSLHHAAGVAAAERDPSPPGLAGQAAAWEQRNRSALIEGYLSTPGADRLVPDDGAVADALLAAAVWARRARRPTGRRAPPDRGDDR